MPSSTGLPNRRPWSSLAANELWYLDGHKCGFGLVCLSIAFGPSGAKRVVSLSGMSHLEGDPPMVPFFFPCQKSMDHVCATPVIASYPIRLHTSLQTDSCKL